MSSVGFGLPVFTSSTLQTGAQKNNAIKKAPFQGADQVHFSRSDKAEFSATSKASKIAGTEDNKSKNEVYCFGTSGYRSIDKFGETEVRQITEALADYLIEEINQKGQLFPVLIGGDTRDKTKQFIPMIAKILQNRGLDVYQVEGDVPTPVLAYAAQNFQKLGLGPQKTLGAVLMTASHNPWAYGGYNFLTPDGAVMSSRVSKKIEAYQKSPQRTILDRKALGANEPAQIKTFDPYPIYKAHLKNMKIDYPAIKNSGLDIYYDALYATGRNYFPRLLNEEGITSTTLHTTEQRPANYKGMPEPVGSNLTELADLMAQSKQKNMKVGFANDGDADRFGVLDETGRCLNPNDVLALILHHMINNKKQTGVVVRSQATTHLLDALAKQAGLSTIQTPVGYKYIAEEFIEHAEKGDSQVLLGGESSGGVSVLGHIPEKDGILANLLIADQLATEGIPLSRLLSGVKASIPQDYVFRELSVRTKHNKAILNHFKHLQSAGGTIAGFQIDVQKSKAAAEDLEKKYGTRDGVKLYFEDGSWMLLRASGTEPIARVYIEGVSDKTDPVGARAKTDKLLKAVLTNLTQDFGVATTDIVEKQ